MADTLSVSVVLWRRTPSSPAEWRVCLRLPGVEPMFLAPADARRLGGMLAARADEIGQPD